MNRYCETCQLDLCVSHLQRPWCKTCNPLRGAAITLPLEDFVPKIFVREERWSGGRAFEEVWAAAVREDFHDRVLHPLREEAIRLRRQAWLHLEAIAMAPPKAPDASPSSAASAPAPAVPQLPPIGSNVRWFQSDTVYAVTEHWCHDGFMGRNADGGLLTALLASEGQLWAREPEKPELSGVPPVGSKILWLNNGQEYEVVEHGPDCNPYLRLADTGGSFLTWPQHEGRDWTRVTPCVASTRPPIGSQVRSLAYGTIFTVVAYSSSGGGGIVVESSHEPRRIVWLAHEGRYWERVTSSEVDLSKADAQSIHDSCARMM